MDKTRAKSLAGEVKAALCNEWLIGEYINCGKSAIVLQAKSGDQTGAIKIFDPELVEKYGAEVQSQRIERERALIGKIHPNLVQIYDGGCWADRGLHYVVMEYIPWRNLAETLRDVPIGKERDIISQIASAARFLESLDLCHRDIKPENIAVSPDFQKAKLLDLGVVKPHGTKSITGGTHGKFFVGTLRYSPPEFLLGKEKDEKEGWRAITFYQIGGVLHDLIMRRPLFAEYENPFALLVNAVQDTKPEIESQAVSPALVELARNCLLKRPELRLQLLSWEEFDREPPALDTIAQLKSRIARRLIATKDKALEPEQREAGGTGSAQRIQEYSASIASICRLECVENRDVFPPVEIHQFCDGASARVIVIQFEPSHAHQLCSFLRIEIHIDWVDASNDVVEVKIAAALSGQAVDSGRSVIATDASRYTGAYAPDSLRRHILPPLYAAIDQAQQRKATKSDSMTALKLEVN